VSQSGLGTEQAQQARDELASEVETYLVEEPQLKIEERLPVAKSSRSDQWGICSV